MDFTSGPVHGSPLKTEDSREDKDAVKEDVKEFVTTVIKTEPGTDGKESQGRNEESVGLVEVKIECGEAEEVEVLKQQVCQENIERERPNTRPMTRARASGHLDIADYLEVVVNAESYALQPHSKKELPCEKRTVTLSKKEDKEPKVSCAKKKKHVKRSSTKEKRKLTKRAAKNAEKKPKIKRRRKQTFNCLYCQEPHSDLDQLREHVRSQHGNKEKSSEQKESSVAPEAEENRVAPEKEDASVAPEKEDQPKQKGYYCPYCDKSFTTLSCLRRHIRGVHENTLPRMPCPLCARPVRRAQMSAHVRSHDANARAPCPQCSSVCKNQRALDVHIYRMHREGSEELTPCAVCGKPMRPSNMASHMRAHRHTGLICAVCSESFTTKRALAEHTYEHMCRDEWRFECNDCGKSFPFRSNITDHIRMQHNKVTCQVCNEVLENSRLHRVHLKQKHGVEREREHACDICEKRFHHARILTEHRRRHTGERPHACRWCGARFVQHSSLWAHFKRQHPGMQWPLPESAGVAAQHEEIIA